MIAISSERFAEDQSMGIHAYLSFLFFHLWVKEVTHVFWQISSYTQQWKWKFIAPREKKGRERREERMDIYAYKHAHGLGIASLEAFVGNQCPWWLKIINVLHGPACIAFLYKGRLYMQAHDVLLLSSQTKEKPIQAVWGAEHSRPHSQYKCMQAHWGSVNPEKTCLHCSVAGLLIVFKLLVPLSLEVLSCFSPTCSWPLHNIL